MQHVADIIEAHTRIERWVHRTPILTCTQISQRLDADIVFKCENFQKTGAFKARGATNAVRSLNESDAKRGVVTHSSGNHAAALAWAAGLCDVPAYIVMPSNAPRVKIAAVEHYGGQITFCEPTQSARESTCQRIQNETGATLIHPYDDPRIIAGQGTAALEFVQDCPDLDLLMTPVGGGGLLAGTAIVARSQEQRIRVWAGEPRVVNDALESLKSGVRQPTTGQRSIADGLLTGIGALTFPIIRESVEEIRLAEESTIRDAQQLIMERMKIVVEPSAAVPLACLMENPQGIAGKKVGIILSGGNFELSNLGRSTV
ncbi:pyridoxal-phosphate dependent enzyme [Thalassoroseus pseudoceratinae]|uniref:pyridoxal-phosphate dependent enzyme n=1 Tax=Thalassoroseus pseudoceratinae TaxID=2713176 RepID=UPI00197DC08E|nr:pyridoxal-phosphate dependent enzyme [Thalassoroseus pseudoceratinae]